MTIDTAVAGIRERDHRNGMKELVGPGLLAKVPFREPRVPMLGNVHASVIRTADGLRRELSEHLVHGVQWTDSVRRMAADGVTDFVEIGPGRVLSGLIKRIAPETRTHALDMPGDGALWLPGSDEVPA